MTSHVKGEHVPPASPATGRSSGAAWSGVAPSLSASARYYFNLTDGTAMIRDPEGIEALSIHAAVVAAVAAVEELRTQDPSDFDEWQGWRLEIVDDSGRALQIIPLDVLLVH